MRSWATALNDRWIGRNRRSDSQTAAARQAVSGLAPATVVTGASRGIGLAIASELAARGHRVVMVGRDDISIKAAAESIAGRSAAPIVTVSCDLAASDAPAVLHQQLAQRALYLDTLVLNAAAGLGGPFERHAPTDVDELIALNVVAASRLIHAAIGEFWSRQAGGLLVVTSLGAFVPGPNQALYYASKAYLQSLTEAIASEVAGHGIRVSILAPGPVDTGFHDSMGAGQAWYRWALPSLSVERVARAAANGLARNQRLIVPGISNMVLLAALKVLPHPISVPLMKWLLAPR